MSVQRRLANIAIPSEWVPGRDSFLRLDLDIQTRMYFERQIPYAEIAASVIIGMAQEAGEFLFIQDDRLEQIHSAPVEVENPNAETIITSRFIYGLRILIEMGFVFRDSDRKGIIARERLLDCIVVTGMRGSLIPSA